MPLRSPLRLLNPKNGRRRNTLWIYYYKTVRFEYLSYNHFRILLFLFKSLLHFQILLPKIWAIIVTAVTIEVFLIMMTRSYKGCPLLTMHINFFQRVEVWNLITHQMRHSPYARPRTSLAMSNSGNPSFLKYDTYLYKSLRKIDIN